MSGLIQLPAIVTSGSRIKLVCYDYVEIVELDPTFALWARNPQPATVALDT